MPKLRDYDTYLIESLKDSKEAYLYLEAAFEDDDPRVAAIALDHVLKARNYTVKQISQAAHLNREHLYRVFSGKSKPEFNTIKSLCTLAGFRLTVQGDNLSAN